MLYRNIPTFQKSTQNHLRILPKLSRNPCHACFEELVEQEQNLKYLGMKLVIQQICFPTQNLAWKMFNTFFRLPFLHATAMYYTFSSLFFPLVQIDNVFFFSFFRFYDRSYCFPQNNYISSSHNHGVFMSDSYLDWFLRQYCIYHWALTWKLQIRLCNLQFLLIEDQ